MLIVKLYCIFILLSFHCKFFWDALAVGLCQNACQQVTMTYFHVLLKVHLLEQPLWWDSVCVCVCVCVKWNDYPAYIKKSCFLLKATCTYFLWHVRYICGNEVVNSFEVHVHKRSLLIEEKTSSLLICQGWVYVAWGSLLELGLRKTFLTVGSNKSVYTSSLPKSNLGPSGLQQNSWIETPIWTIQECARPLFDSPKGGLLER